MGQSTGFVWGSQQEYVIPMQKDFFPQHADMEEIITGFRHKNVGYEMHYQVLELGINIIETNKDLMNKYCKIEVTN